MEPEESDVDEEAEEEAKPKKGKKKPKLGRADISAKRHFAPASLTASTAHQETKRKASESDKAESGGQSKKKKAKGSALLQGWDAKHGSESRTQDADEEDDSMVRPGGFVADGETDFVERKSLSGFKGKKIVMNNIKISDSKPMTQSTKRAQRGGATKWKLDHLPSGTSAAFTESLAPLAKIKVGALDAWEGLSSDQIQHLVDTIFPEDGHIVEDNDVWGGLVGYRLSNWRNGFFTHARTAVKNFLEAGEEIHVEGPADIAEYVGLFTEIQGDPPTAPFHWRVWDEDEETGKTIKKGCLQNELIMYTLAHAHFSEYEDIPDPRDLHPSELPGGALILAMQAVEHAFTFWRTGEFVEDKSSHFSADRYGDTVKRKPGADGGRAKDVKVLVAGRYKPTIRSLTVEKHWVPIFKAVTDILSVNRKKKARSKSASSRASSEMIIDETPEFILVSDED
ncbi:hypothetical protein GALMADRAFT_1026983 [Galerina marginata CBS 339.88]|uniref:DUF6532 domain-containing protein n=1 Tax=Galerina marginata (strain CBS 339.88) TaxID=685588 RepID=A0A067SPM8_GALM3|nr:hypothetical protein GALMADRAFT_1026983 [Galerina marginata CBS 339.88]